MKKKLVDIIVGARPNFIKVAPLFSLLKNDKKYSQYFNYRLIHTGQHYSKFMSDDFFKQLNIPKPNCNFNISSGSNLKQISQIILCYEKLLKKRKSDLCVVVGDVNSTLACSLAAKQMNIRIAHIEAGLRSKDLSMPEEINRIITDSVSDIFFTTSKFANKNLLDEGVHKKKIFFVGNIMIDTLMAYSNQLSEPKIWSKFDLKKKNYLLLTLHRPSNVDKQIYLEKILSKISKSLLLDKIIFPVHPRTKKIIKKINNFPKNIILIDPLPYLEFSYLLKHSLCTITDSGGITEEATVYKVPCLTMRNSTERPETILTGSNELVGKNIDKISDHLSKIKKNKWKKSRVPTKWDGKTSHRILHILMKEMNI